MWKADKKAESRGGFFGGGGSAKYEEAAELYTQAANAFRLQKQGIPPSPSAQD
jgi:alpha-soluble NSF attachment protein